MTVVKLLNSWINSIYRFTLRMEFKFYFMFLYDWQKCRHDIKKTIRKKKCNKCQYVYIRIRHYGDVLRFFYQGYNTYTFFNVRLNDFSCIDNRNSINEHLVLCDTTIWTSMWTKCNIKNNNRESICENVLYTQTVYFVLVA